MNRRGVAVIFAGLLCALLSGLGTPSAAAQSLADLARLGKADRAGGGLFGSVEFESGSLKALPQWTRVLSGMESDRAALERCAASTALCTTPFLKHWRRIITAAARLKRADRVKAVNDFFNRWPYKQDIEIYGMDEYWATPKEFMTRSGDCEDYSIAKYFALRELGFDKRELRVVILLDEIRGIGHAVLAVYVENDIVILDSLSNLILPHTRYKHYIPQFSMNETTRWAHVGGFKRDEKPVYRGLVAGNRN